MLKESHYEIQYFFDLSNSSARLVGSRLRRITRWLGRWESKSRWVETGQCKGPVKTISVPEISGAAIKSACRVNGDYRMEPD